MQYMPENDMEYEISFSCANCHGEIAAPGSMAGQDIPCPGCGASIEIPLPGLTAGLELGEFVLIRKIGSGGMGEVWLAEQNTLHRKVALKILQPKLVANERFIRRFLTEARLSGQLEHPNIVTAYAAGKIGSFYYLATSYIDGVELNNRLKAERRLPEREALKIARSVAEALRYAWNEHRMIHRDIKPANIMIDAYGNPRLMDFGISKIISAGPDPTLAEDLCGTPEYISPEQIEGSPDIDFHSDIYSLGITLFHLISGVLPFKGTNAEETLHLQLNNPLPRPENFQSGISPQCYRLIEFMTSKAPAERHSSWDYVISDIDLVLAGKSPVGRILTEYGDSAKVQASAPDAPIRFLSAVPQQFAPRHQAQAAEDYEEDAKTVPVQRPEPDPEPETTAPPQPALSAIPPKIEFRRKPERKPLSRLILPLGIVFLLLLFLLILLIVLK
jgi:serine/threonine-protein kinase